MAALERWLLQSDVRGVAFFTLSLAVLASLTIRRKTMVIEQPGIMNEDEPNPDLQTLGARRLLIASCILSDCFGSRA